MMITRLIFECVLAVLGVRLPGDGSPAPLGVPASLAAAACTGAGSRAVAGAASADRSIAGGSGVRLQAALIVAPKTTRANALRHDIRPIHAIRWHIGQPVAG